MTRGAILLALTLALAACTSGPRPNVGIGLGGGGAVVYPSVSGTVAGVGVNVGGLIH